MDVMVNELVEKKNLTKEDIVHLVQSHGHTKPVSVSILDIREAKLREFQEMSSKGRETYKS